jgi:hypothetical protein
VWAAWFEAALCRGSQRPSSQASPPPLTRCRLLGGASSPAPRLLSPSALA